MLEQMVDCGREFERCAAAVAANVRELVNALRESAAAHTDRIPAAPAPGTSACGRRIVGVSPFRQTRRRMGPSTPVSTGAARCAG
jgi:hypothetical protein